VHQTVTVRKLSADARIIREGFPTDQDTWFPGYAWTILYCRLCRNHLGWHFTSTDPGVAARQGTLANAVTIPLREALLDRLQHLMNMLRARNNEAVGMNNHDTEMNNGIDGAELTASSRNTSHHSISVDSATMSVDASSSSGYPYSDDDDLEFPEGGTNERSSHSDADAVDDEFVTPRGSLDHEREMMDFVDSPVVGLPTPDLPSLEVPSPATGVEPVSDAGPTTPEPVTESTASESVTTIADRGPALTQGDDIVIEMTDITGEQFHEIVNELLPAEQDGLVAEKVPEFWLVYSLSKFSRLLVCDRGMRRAAVVELTDD
jgi:hypothetical protein